VGWQAVHTLRIIRAQLIIKKEYEVVLEEEA
jgi:hypothetical protein